MIACKADRTLFADTIRASSLHRLHQQAGQTTAPDGTSDHHFMLATREPSTEVVLHASLTVPAAEAGGSPRFIAHGTGGTLIKRLLDPQETQLVAGLRPGNDGWGVDPDPVEIYDAGGRMTKRPALVGCQERFYAQVAVAIQSGGPLPTPVEDALAVQAVIEMAQRSAREGRCLPL